MTVLREDAEKIWFLGVEVYAFGLYVCLGLALAMLVMGVLVRRGKGRWASGTAALTGVLSIGIGFLVSRLFFGLMDGIAGQPMPLWALVRFNSGGYSMIGALLGACMGAVLSARITRQSAPRLLDLLAPALLLFIACERLGEGHIEDFGVSRKLTVDLPESLFLVSDGRLNTYLLESFSAVVLAIVLLRDLSMKRREGDTFLEFLLLFGAVQVLMESLRKDGHMTVNAFVRLEMILSMMLLGCGVIVLFIRSVKRRPALSWAALISVFAAVGLGVLIEFKIDRSQISHYLLYAAFIAVLAVPTALGMLLRKEGGQSGQA